MQTLITSHHIDLGDSLRAYAEKSITEHVSKYFADAVRADVRVSKENNTIKTEVIVQPVAGMTVRGTAVTGDAYSSFDAAVAKLSKQLNRYKNKLVDHKVAAAEQVPMSIIESDEDKEVADAPIIIADMTTELPTCTVSQAVMQMDLAGVNALLFKNASTGTYNMVYRRLDGNIGWVNPQK